MHGRFAFLLLCGMVLAGCDREPVLQHYEDSVTEAGCRPLRNALMEPSLLDGKPKFGAPVSPDKIIDIARSSGCLRELAYFRANLEPQLRRSYQAYLASLPPTPAQRRKQREARRAGGLTLCRHRDDRIGNIFIYRSGFTSGIKDREPVDDRRYLSRHDRKIYFYTEVVGSKDRRVVHRWLYNGQRVAEVPFSVKGQRWRTWSSKNLMPGRPGTWKVQVLDQSGCLIDEEWIEVNDKIAQGLRRDKGIQPSTALFRSIWRGQTKTVARLLRDKTLVHDRNERGDTPLHAAVRTGNQEMVAALLRLGANPHYRDSGGQLALDIAQEFNNAPLQRVLARRMQQLARPWTVVQHAVTSAVQDDRPADCLSRLSVQQPRRLYFYNLILDMQGEKIVHRWRHDDGRQYRTVLTVDEPEARVFSARLFSTEDSGRWMLTVEDSRKRILAQRELVVTGTGGRQGAVFCDPQRQLLLPLVRAWAPRRVFETLFRNGVTLDYKTSGGRAVAREAIVSGNINLTRLLLEYGLPVDGSIGEDLETPLLLAVKEGNSVMTRFLIRRGAELNPRWGQQPSPLVAAIYRNNVDLVNVLLKSGADPDMRSQGVVPLAAAVDVCNMDMVQMLLDHGASLNGRRSNRLPVVYSKVQCLPGKPWRQVYRLVYPDDDLGIDMDHPLNRYDEDGETPLFHAGSARAVRELLKKGASLEAWNRLGDTPLLSAVKRNDIGRVELLLQSGANVNHRNKRGLSALAVAVNAGAEELVMLLLRYGADPQLTDIENKTAFDHAAENGHPQLLKLLRHPVTQGS